jgi:hypothetical protein
MPHQRVSGWVGGSGMRVRVRRGGWMRHQRRVGGWSVGASDVPVLVSSLCILWGRKQTVKSSAFARIYIETGRHMINRTYMNPRLISHADATPRVLPAPCLAFLPCLIASSLPSLPIGYSSYEIGISTQCADSHAVYKHAANSMCHIVCHGGQPSLPEDERQGLALHRRDLE